jgi:hypothetical protein
VHGSDLFFFLWARRAFPPKPQHLTCFVLYFFLVILNYLRFFYSISFSFFFITKTIIFFLLLSLQVLFCTALHNVFDGLIRVDPIYYRLNIYLKNNVKTLLSWICFYHIKFLLSQSSQTLIYLVDRII